MATTNTGEFGDGNRGVQVVSNTGSIVTHHHTHLAAGESASPLQPHSIPLPRRVRDYVENKQATDRLEELAAGEATRVAVAGFGGVGKTQLAINYLHKTRERDTDVWTLWIYAGNAARFDESIGDVTDQLQLHDEHSGNNKLFLLQKWLQDTSKRWILVLDNVDTASYLHEPPAGADLTQAKKPRIDYLPHCPHGTLIITSRNKEVARMLVETEDDMIEVSAMSLCDSKTYLKKKLTTRYDDETATRLAVALDCIPLALDHAASYIAQRRRVTVENYLTLLETNRQARTTLLQQQVARPARDRESCDSVTATWQISFEHIDAEHKTAAGMLALMSLCDRQSIPAFLLKGQLRNASAHRAPASPWDMPFENDIQILENYSFILPGNDEETWTMHRLVQESMLLWLQEHDREHENTRRFVAKLLSATPDYSRDNWPDYQILLPHVRSCDFIESLGQDDALALASVLQVMSGYSLTNCLYYDTIAFHHSIWQVYKRWHGPRDERTIEAQSFLGQANLCYGSLDEAEEHLVFVVKTLQEQYGDDNDLTTEALTHLAALYEQRADHEAAAITRERVLESTQRRHGLRDNRTLLAMVTLALSYARSGSIIEAFRLCELVLDTRQEYLSDEPMVTLLEYSIISLIYRVEGRHSDAIVLDQEILILADQFYPESHDAVNTAHANLGQSFQALQHHEQAEEHLKKAVRGWMRMFGLAHDSTLRTMLELADTYFTVGSFAAAGLIRQQVLNTAVMALGYEHPLTRDAMLNLAQSLEQQDPMSEMFQSFRDTTMAIWTSHSSQQSIHISSQAGSPATGPSPDGFQQCSHTFTVEAFLDAWQASNLRGSKEAIFEAQGERDANDLAAALTLLSPVSVLADGREDTGE